MTETGMTLETTDKERAWFLQYMAEWGHTDDGDIYRAAEDAHKLSRDIDRLLAANEAKAREIAEKDAAYARLQHERTYAVNEGNLMAAEIARLKSRPTSEEVATFIQWLSLGAELWAGTSGQTEYLKHVDLVRRLAKQSDGWRPIETAPEDTMVLTLWDGWNKRTNEPARHYVAASLIDGSWIDDNGEAIDEPTHWQPLPSPPSPPSTEDRT